MMAYVSYLNFVSAQYLTVIIGVQRLYALHNYAIHLSAFGG